MAEGSPNYAYIVGTNERTSVSFRPPSRLLTPPAVSRGAAVPSSNSFAKAVSAGSSPVQSDIWTLDWDDRFWVTWVNADGSAVDADIVYNPDTNAFVLVGDSAAYRKMYGEAWETVSARILTLQE